MADGEEQVASLRWAIDRQKSDLANIRKQLRRYLVAGISAVVVGATSIFGGSGVLQGFASSTPLVESGVLWQSNILPTKAASVFVDIFTTFTVVFGGIALSSIGLWMLTTIKIEGSEDCHLIGDAGDIIEEDYEKLKEWVDKNDKIIEEADNSRKQTLKFGRKVVVLLLAILLLRFSARNSAVVASIVLMVVYYLYWSLFIYEDFFQDTRYNRSIHSIIIFFTLMVPLTSYQDVYGYFSNTIILGWIGFVLGTMLIYIFPKSREYIRSTSRYIAEYASDNEEIDSNDS